MRKITSFLLVLVAVAGSLSFAQVKTARMLDGVRVITASGPILTTDVTKLVIINCASACSITISAPTVPGFGIGSIYSIRNVGATATINGNISNVPAGSGTSGSNLILTTNQGTDLYSSGTDYQLDGITNSGALGFSGVPTGTCVGAQIAMNTLTGDLYGCAGGTWVLGSGGGGAPVGNNGDTQIKNGASLAAGGFNDNGTLVIENRDVAECGPNKTFDIRCFKGYISATPPTTTGTINASSAVLAINAAGDYANGQGIVVAKAGALPTITTPGTPTVTPSALLNGGTIWNYKVISEDYKGGLTAATAAGSTSVGQATLGLNTIAVSSATRISGVTTYTTGSAHNLQVGATVLICQFGGGSCPGTFSDSFNGTKVVVATPTSTTFTVNEGNLPDASETPGSGQANVLACNTLTFPVNSFAGSGTLRNWIYRSQGAGSYALQGVAVGLDPYWVDCGGNPPNAPAYIPSTPPASAQAGYLATTISSGGGTTTLTLTNAAGTSVVAASVLHDNTPALIAAGNAAAAQGGGTVYIPSVTNSGGSPVFWSFNSLADLTGISAANSNYITILVNGYVGLAQPWNLRSNILIQGMTKRNTSFMYPGGAMIGGNAQPLLYVNTKSSITLRNLMINSQGPQSSGLYTDNDTGGQGSVGIILENTAVGTQGGGGYARPMVLKGGFDYSFRQVTCDPSSGSMLLPNECAEFTDSSTAVFNGTSQIPGRVAFDYSYFNNSGILVDSAPNSNFGSGNGYRFNGMLAESLYTPFLRIGPMGFTTDFNLTDVIDSDQISGSATPIVDASGSSLQAISITGGLVTLGAPPMVISGFNGTNLVGNHLPSSNPGNVPYFAANLSDVQVSNQTLSAKGTGHFTYQMALPGALTGCSVTTGGTLAVGSITLTLTAVDYDGNETTVGTPVTLTTSSGNQTISGCAIPALPPGAKGFNGYVNGFRFNPGSCASPQITSGPVTFNGSTCGNSAPSVNQAGSSILSSTGITAWQLRLAGQLLTAASGTGNTVATTTGTLVLGHCVSIDAGGNFVDAGSACGGGGSSFYQTVKANGSAQTQRPALNLISGANSTVSCVDNGGTTTTDCTFASTANITPYVVDNTSGVTSDGQDCIFSLTAGGSTLTITGGSCSFSAGSAPAGSVGKIVTIQGANGGLLAYTDTIASFTNSTTVSLTNHTSTTTVSNASGSMGTDNCTPLTTAFTNAGAAATDALILFPYGHYYLSSCSLTIPLNASVELDARLQAGSQNVQNSVLQTSTSTGTNVWNHKQLYGLGSIDLANLITRGMWFHQGRQIDVYGLHVFGMGLTNALGFHVGDTTVGQLGGYQINFYHVNFGAHSGTFAQGGSNSRCVYIDNTTNGRFTDVHTDTLLQNGCAFGIYDGTGGNFHSNDHFWGPSLNTAFVDQAGSYWTQIEADTPSTYGFDIQGSHTFISNYRAFMSTTGVDNAAICIHSTTTDPALNLQGMYCQGADSSHRWASDSNLVKANLATSQTWGIQNTNVVTQNIPNNSCMSAIGDLCGAAANGFPVRIPGGITGQTPVATTGAIPAFASPGLADGNGGSPVSTSPYTLQCDSGTAIVDRSHITRFTSGAGTVNVPLSTASGCLGNPAFAVMDVSAGTLTFNRTSTDTFTVVNGGAALTLQTSFTLTNGQYATINQGATGIYEVRIVTCPNITAGTNVSVSGSCPNQTINVTPFTVIQSGLMAEYRMLPSESPGSLVDYSGNGNNATGTVGTSPTIISSSGGLNFTGNGAVSLPSALNSALTIMIFAAFQPTAALPSPEPVQVNASLVQGNDASFNAVTMELFHTHDSNFLVTTTANQLPLQGGFRPITRNKTATNQGFNVMDVASFSGVNTLTLTMGAGDQYYINGVAITQTLSSASAANQSAGNYQLGGAAAGQGQSLVSWFTGQMYYAVFYNRVLTQAEITANHNTIVQAMTSRGINLAPGVIQNTDRASQIVTMGDSITAGVVGGAPQSWTQWLGLPIAGQPAVPQVENAAVGGSTILVRYPFGNIDVDSLYRPGALANVMTYWVGTNDGASVVQDWGVSRDYLLQRRARGFKTIPVTMLSRGSSNDQWKDALNPVIRAGWNQYSDALCDMAANPNLGADGAFANTTYFAVDQIHPTVLANQFILAPMMNACIDKIYGNRDFSTARTVVAPSGIAFAAGGNFNISALGWNFFGTAHNTVPGEMCMVFVQQTTAPTWLYDSSGDTWQLLTSSTNGGSVWYSRNMRPGPLFINISGTPSSGSYRGAWGCWTGVGNYAPESFANANSSGTTMTGGSVTPLQNNSLIVGIGGTAFNASTLAGSGSYTLRTSAADQHSWIVDFVQGTAGATTPTATSGTSLTSYGMTSVVWAPQVTGLVQLADTDVVVNANPTPASMTVMLPIAAGITGQTVTIKNTQTSGANTLTVVPRGYRITNAVGNGTIFTFTVDNTYFLVPGQTVTVSGCTTGTFNGTFTVNTVPSTTTFTVTNATVITTEPEPIGALYSNETIDGATSSTISNSAVSVYQSVLFSNTAGGANWVKVQ